MTQDLVSRRWIVRGRVQGVGYRWFAIRQAERLGVVGWVANRPDGAVEVVAQGTAPQIDSMHQALSTGPRSGHVESVEMYEMSPEIEAFKSFEVRYL